MAKELVDYMKEPARQPRSFACRESSGVSGIGSAWFPLVSFGIG
jgi:hypothetical protein